MTDENILFLTSDLQMVKLVQTHFTSFFLKLVNMCIMYVCVYVWVYEYRI